MSELLQPRPNHVTGSVMIAHAVETDFESLAVQLQHECQVVAVLQCCRPQKSSPADIAQRPDGLVGSQSDLSQQPVLGSDILDGAVVSIIEDSESECFPLWKPARSRRRARTGRGTLRNCNIHGLYITDSASFVNSVTRRSWLKWARTYLRPFSPIAAVSRGCCVSFKMASWIACGSYG